MNENNDVMIPDELIMSRIYQIRGQQVMIDSDLAMLYGVETRRLNEQVRRNPERFPEDFMFRLNEGEFKNLKSQFATSNRGGRRKLPYAFTEHGVLMLSSVLSSDRAIKVNIHIMRIYVSIRHMISVNKDLALRLDSFEFKVSEHDDQILSIFEYLRILEQSRQQQEQQAGRKKIGFRKDDP